MSDISISAASVLPGAGAVTEDGLAGATLTAGQIVYRDTDNSYKLADCNGASATIRTPRGVALNGASAGQPVRIQKQGEITIGGTLTAGTSYYLSGTPGGLRPVADNTTGDYPSHIGISKSTTVLLLAIAASGVSL
jgi:hypothetical protein